LFLIKIFKNIKAVFEEGIAIDIMAKIRYMIRIGKKGCCLQVR